MQMHENSRNIDGKEVTNEETFDAVMICNGHLATPSTPKIPGMEKFKGVKVHSAEYRTFHPYVGKRVVVVGCGFSGGERKYLKTAVKHVLRMNKLA
jgi:dimethylaniline monooxygenase (N-oxide forming)